MTEILMVDDTLFTGSEPLTLGEFLSLLPERDRHPISIEALKQWRGARVVVTRQGNFTVATIQPVNGSQRGRIATGVAKRNPDYDEDDPVRGRRIAIVRAWRQYQDHGLQ